MRGSTVLAPVVVLVAGQVVLPRLEEVVLKVVEVAEVAELVVEVMEVMEVTKVVVEVKVVKVGRLLPRLVVGLLPVWAG